MSAHSSESDETLIHSAFAFLLPSTGFSHSICSKSDLTFRQNLDSTSLSFVKSAALKSYLYLIQLGCIFWFSSLLQSFLYCIILISAVIQNAIIKILASESIISIDLSCRFLNLCCCCCFLNQAKATSRSRIGNYQQKTKQEQNTLDMSTCVLIVLSVSSRLLDLQELPDRLLGSCFFQDK